MTTNKKITIMVETQILADNVSGCAVTLVLKYSHNAVLAFFLSFPFTLFISMIISMLNYVLFARL